ncbi:MAG: hypothetical protein CVU98_01135 [Firmicutes bacterium HGW-Firmicutes-3]|jgi:predicted ATP-grasp superfamily ATP-dependent carboligase|nr:MAG: hypothetical protein CVU98_01135 [Firmicutes bacterium HGW-Firmicutes-3]
MNNILLLANENERAAITCLRSLERHSLSVHLAFSNKSFINLLIFKNYINKSHSYYNKSSEEEFLQSLISIKNEIGDYLVFPFGDQLSYWLVKNNELLKNQGIIVNGPKLDAFNTMLDKKCFLDYANKHGISIPKEIDIKKILSGNFKSKFVIKSNENSKDDSNVIKAPVLIENNKSFRKLIEKKLTLEKHFVQEYLDGPSIYYCAYYKNGVNILFFSQITVCQQPGGKSVIKAIPYNLSTKIIEKIDGMMFELDWSGPMMIELKKNKSDYYAIECNPRLWGPLQLALDNGVDFPSCLAGINIVKEKTNNIGFIWRTGYLIGLLYKIQTNTKFQKNKYDMGKKIKYRDIWFLKDTYVYGVMEFFIIVFDLVRKKLRRK